MASEPTRPDLTTWPHYELYRRVRDALAAVPAQFATEIFISGVLATDLHTLNSALGAAIEEQVVATLNAMRATWDPDDKYALFSFVRQPQTFPDVLLRRAASATPSPDDILMGIELKGWYLLAKEEKPTFRFTVTPAACNPQDLLVVVPWALAQVISGRPMAFTPYIVEARYAAEWRNHHWTNVREAKGDRTITSPTVTAPYQSKRDATNDVAKDDRGNNFGRFARTGLMDSYLDGVKERLLCGIRVRHWLAFFKSFQEAQDDARIHDALTRLTTEISDEVHGGNTTASTVETILDGLRRLVFPEGDPIE